MSKATNLENELKHFDRILRNHETKQRELDLINKLPKAMYGKQTVITAEQPKVSNMFKPKSNMFDDCKDGVSTTPKEVVFLGKQELVKAPDVSNNEYKINQYLLYRCMQTDDFIYSLDRFNWYTIDQVSNSFNRMLEMNENKEVVNGKVLDSTTKKYIYIAIKKYIYIKKD